MAAILCIDVSEVLTTRRMVLEHHGYRVLTAHERAEALQILQQEEVDCVIGRHDPLQFDGRPFLAAIRRAYPHLPIVLLAVFAPEAASSLADECLSNLDGPEALLQSIQRVLKRSTKTETMEVMRRIPG